MKGEIILLMFNSQEDLTRGDHYITHNQEVSRIGQGRTESFNCVCNVLLHNLGNMYKVFFFFPRGGGGSVYAILCL